MELNKLLLRDILKEKILPGVTLSSRVKDETGSGETVKVLSIKDINQDALYLADDVGDITEVKDASSLEKFQLRKGDAVISTKGSAIKTAVFRGDNKLIASGNLTILRCDEKIITPEFLAIFLKSDRVVRELQTKSKGSGILSLSTSDLGQIQVPLPSLEIQQDLIKLHRELEIYTTSRLEEIKSVRLAANQKTEEILHNQKVN